MRRKATSGGEPTGPAGGAVERQRARLARWLAEWQVEQALESGARGAEGPPGDPAVGAWDAELVADFGAEAAPAVGQIRILDPAMLPPEVARPCFVAVLAQEGGHAWRAAAFGRFAEPALPGEWLTGRESPPLRVLCLWCAWRLPTAALARSWVVDALTAVELGHALTVLANFTSGAAMPADLAEDVGPPLLHPDDPRHVYRNRETVLMERIGQFLAPAYGFGEGSGDLRRAAEDRDPYGTPPEK